MNNENNTMNLKEKIKNYKELDYEGKMGAVEDITAFLIEQYDTVFGDEPIHPKTYNEVVKSVSGLLKNLSSLNMYNRDAAMKDNIDFTHPKIQRGMYFLMETIIQIMKESGVSEEQIGVFANTASIKLIGFEDKLNSVLKKISSSIVETVPNPLVEKALGHDPKDK